MGSKARLGDILLEVGEIDAAQLEAALREQDESGRPLGMTLVRMGVLREDTLVRTLAQQLSLPMARLEGKRISPEVLDLVPFDLAEKHRCFPLFVKPEDEGRALYVGMEDASDLDAIEEISSAAGLTIRPVLVAPSEIEEALHRRYQVIAGGHPAPLSVDRTTSAESGSATPGEALPPPPSDPGFDGTGLSANLGDLDPNELSDGEAEFDSGGLRDALDLGGFDAGPGDDGPSGDFDAGPGDDGPIGDFDAGPGDDGPSGDFDAGPGDDASIGGFDTDDEALGFEEELGSVAEGEDAGDTAPDLDVGPSPEADTEPRRVEPDSAPGHSFDDSLGEFAPELELDPPGSEAEPESEPQLELDAPDDARSAADPVGSPSPFGAPEPPVAAAASVSRDAILRALSQLLVEKGVIARDELIARVHRESGGDDGS